MRLLAFLAVPAIVVTSVLHAGVQPEPVTPPVLALSKAERVKLIAGLAADHASRRAGDPHLY